MDSLATSSKNDDGMKAIQEGIRNSTELFDALSNSRDPRKIRDKP